MPHLDGDNDGVGYGVTGTAYATGFIDPKGFGGGIVPTPKPPVAVGVFGVGSGVPGVLGQNTAGGPGSGHTPQGSTVGAVWGDSFGSNGVYGSSANWNGVEG